MVPQNPDTKLNNMISFIDSDDKVVNDSYIYAFY